MIDAQDEQLKEQVREYWNAHPSVPNSRIWNGARKSSLPKSNGSGTRLSRS